MTKYSIVIKNCNSIDEANIGIVKECLNIKYGPNGVGKSTIAKSILAASKKDGSLNLLMPFKYRSDPGENVPSVSGIDGINSTLVFDDEYVSQFVFQRDEVLKDSFDIFINTDDFKAAIAEIDVLFADIKTAFDSSEELEQAISNFKELRDAFGVTKTGKISKSSKGFKAFGSGNKIENIPEKLKSYEDFLKSEQPSSWIAWQEKGNGFLDLSENCPYCSSSLEQESKKETARLVATEYNSKSVEHLNALQAIIDRLGKYFQETSRESLEKITKSKLELSPEEINFLGGLRGDIETLLVKLEGLRSISFFSLRDVEKIEETVEKLKINLDLINNLNSAATKEVIDPVNSTLDVLIAKVGILKGEINKHKGQIAKTIAENQRHINNFLSSAGYKYSVQIEPEAESYKMKLVHQDRLEEHLEAASDHLSYGEKNAFALVLFMHQVLREKPDLIVLDDPVSSFDKTKKFAILSQLFRGKLSLRDSTVLMLTHDIEPIVDVKKSVRRLFQTPEPSACFLAGKSGMVRDIEIQATDIQTFAQICEENIAAVNDDIIKCIYLRRHFEILGDMGSEYNFLASLLHGRDTPTKLGSEGQVNMTTEEISQAMESIEKHIPTFDPSAILDSLQDANNLRELFNSASVGYDKLQIFRIFSQLHRDDANKDDSVFQKFINEAFHIENEYVMQLNPHKFDNVPEYIIEECARIMGEA